MVVLLVSYHINHFNEHIGPYAKRLEMFERRSFYAPPIITSMDKWTSSGGGGRAL